MCDRAWLVQAGALVILAGSWVVWALSPRYPGWWIPLVVMIVATAGYVCAVVFLAYLRWYVRRVRELRRARDFCAECQQSSSVWESPRGEYLTLCAVHRAAVPLSHRWNLAG